MRFFRLTFAAAALPAILLWSSAAAHASTTRVTTLFHFNGKNGSNPIGPLTFDASGNLFGITRYGGKQGVGAVFELSPPPPGHHLWIERTLYTFKGDRDGAFPTPGLIFDNAGDLYGTTTGGGMCQYSCGTIYRLVPPNNQHSWWTKETLHLFSGPGFGDGGVPSRNLTFDANGNLFGTTLIGGDEDCTINPGPCGEVFELSPPPMPGGQWTINVLYTFTGPPDGAFPRAGVVFGADGNLYGSTSQGGSGFCTDGEGTVIGCGTIYKLTFSGGAWTQTRLFNFHPTEFNPGTVPGFARGAMLGAAEYDVFRLTPQEPGEDWNEVLLFRFPEGVDGSITESDPVAGAFGHHLFGTTRASGIYGFGSIYSLTPPARFTGSWTAQYLVMYTGGTEVEQPSGGLVVGKDGDLYGALASDNQSNPGEIIKVRP